MPNAARRLLDALTRAVAASPGASASGSTAYQVWSGVLQAGSVPEPARQFEVLRLLGLLREELVAVRLAAAASAGVRPAAYEAQLASIEQALLPGRFHGHWSDSATYLTRDTITALTFLADLLPDDEAALPREALASLLEEVAALEKLVRESELPDDLRRFVFMQLDAIRAAVREYPIRGTVGLRAAFAKAVFEWNEDFPPDQPDSTVTTRFRRILAKVALIVGTASAGVAGFARFVKNVRDVQTTVPAVAQELGIPVPGMAAPRQLPSGARADSTTIDAEPDRR